MKKIVIAVILILAAIFAWWYFNRSAAKVSQIPSSGTTIEIKNFKYSPETLTVKAGEKITVINKDLAGHSVTADDGSFDSGVLTKDAPGMITAPAKPGTYPFHCTPHPSIKGSLIVE